MAEEPAPRPVNPDGTATPGPAPQEPVAQSAPPPQDPPAQPDSPAQTPAAPTPAAQAPPAQPDQAPPPDPVAQAAAPPPPPPPPGAVPPQPGPAGGPPKGFGGFVRRKSVQLVAMALVGAVIGGGAVAIVDSSGRHGPDREAVGPMHRGGPPREGGRQFTPRDGERGPYGGGQFER